MLRLQPSHGLGFNPLDPCSIIKSIPGISDIIKRAGCTPAGKAAVQAALKSGLKDKVSSDVAGLLATIGPDVAYGCMCPGGSTQPQPYQPYMPLQTAPLATPWYKNPWVIGGIGAGVLGLFLVITLAGKKG